MNKWWIKVVYSLDRMAILTALTLHPLLLPMWLKRAAFNKENHTIERESYLIKVLKAKAKGSYHQLFNTQWSGSWLISHSLSVFKRVFQKKVNWVQKLSGEWDWSSKLKAIPGWAKPPQATSTTGTSSISIVGAVTNHSQFLPSRPLTVAVGCLVLVLPLVS